MLFNVETDLGYKIEGYFVPDSYSGTASILITAEGREVGLVEPAIARPSLVAAGRHGSGICGFVVSTDQVPELPNLPYIELHEAASRFTFYRRCPEQSVIKQKLFRLELCENRLHGLDSSLSKLFAMTFPAVDKHGRETILQTQMLGPAASVYVSARVQFREYEYSIAEGTSTVCVVPDPFVELAETIIAFATGTDLTRSLGLREQLSADDLTEFCQSIDLTDDRALRRSLASIPDGAESWLANPTSRLLAARTSDETPNSTYISASLTTLASFDIVGIRAEPASFVEPIAELLGVAPASMPDRELSAGVRKLADRLREMDSAQSLLEMDLEIYEKVCSALDPNVDVSSNIAR